MRLDEEDARRLEDVYHRHQETFHLIQAATHRRRLDQMAMKPVADELTAELARVRQKYNILGNFVVDGDGVVTEPVQPVSGDPVPAVQFTGSDDPPPTVRSRR